MMVYTGVTFTEQHEGYRDRAYPDSGGVWTCGYGHTQGVGPSTVCTPELAQEWLQQDLRAATNAVNNLVTVPLTQEEFNALVDFTFNVGVRAFSKSTLLILLNESDFSGASLQFERWVLCKGHVVAGLLNRRKDEKALFDSGNHVGGDVSNEDTE